jgi:hypothetical protein
MEVTRSHFLWSGARIVLRLSDMLKVVFPVEVSHERG